MSERDDSVCDYKKTCFPLHRETLGTPCRIQYILTFKQTVNFSKPLQKDRKLIDKPIFYYIKEDNRLKCCRKPDSPDISVD